MDFLFCGHVKDVVRIEKVFNSVQLTRRSAVTVSSVKPGVPQRTWAEVEYWFGVYKATNGAHIETQ